MPLLEENNYLPDLKAIPEDIVKRAKLLYINYPNNPTGAFATEEFFKEVIEFAKANNIVVIQDAAYAALTFDGQKPYSFLSVPGAKEVGVEINFFSKAFNMTGWRLAFVVGNPLVVKAFGQIKDNNDSGQFHAIQLAGKYALEHPEITEETSEKYSRRHDMLVETLNKLGFKAKKPKASFYLYVKVPKGVKGGIEFKTGEDFSQYLIRENLFLLCLGMMLVATFVFLLLSLLMMKLMKKELWMKFIIDYQMWNLFSNYTKLKGWLTALFA